MQHLSKRKLVVAHMPVYPPSAALVWPCLLQRPLSHLQSAEPSRLGHMNCFQAASPCHANKPYTLQAVPLLHRMSALRWPSQGPALLHGSSMSQSSVRMQKQSCAYWGMGHLL